jgi:serine protease
MLGVWLFRLQGADDKQEMALINWLDSQAEVAVTQPNWLLQPRHKQQVMPDDPLFDTQWHLLNTGQSGGTPGADLGAVTAWNITTGATGSAAPVVAVIDGGIDMLHQDLAPNLWINAGETPSDGIDNDGNGYIDDFLGWNVFLGNDQILTPLSAHGSQVTGVLGARGNNSQGIVGVVWDTRVMFVAGTGTVSSLLEAFDYPWKAKKRFLETSGQSGANVVAVNCSWGIDHGKPADAPLWCAALDALGDMGMVSVAPVANNAVDIDAVGDLPGTCPSPYLIAVTNVDHHRRLASNAAVGAQHVDLGAFGTDILTTNHPEAFAVVSGTSVAAPQVAGALALLFSAPCPTLSSESAANPAAAALWAKALILEHTTPVEDMLYASVSGGALHLGNLLSMYEQACGRCEPAINPRAQPTSDGEGIELTWTALTMQQRFEIDVQLDGAIDWKTYETAEPFLKLPGLPSCTQGVFRMRAQCAADNWSSYTRIMPLPLVGCCLPPSAPLAESADSTSALLRWLEVEGATGYSVAWKTPESPQWTETRVDSAAVELSGLSPCTAYLVQVVAHCPVGASEPSAISRILTAGCGPCVDLPTCMPGSPNAQFAWIASVQIGPWSENSGPAPGYTPADPCPTAALTLMPNQTLPVSIQPGFTTFFPAHFFRIFIDYNGNGAFESPEEIAFDPGFALDGPASGLLHTPDFHTNGQMVRMRIAMKLQNALQPPPEPCAPFAFGQVRDYCVWLRQTSDVPAHAPPRTGKLACYPNPAGSGGTWIQTPHPDEPIEQVMVHRTNGSQMLRMLQPTQASTVWIDTAGWPAGLYLISLLQAGAYYHNWIAVP